MFCEEPAKGGDGGGTHDGRLHALRRGGGWGQDTVLGAGGRGKLLAEKTSVRYGRIGATSTAEAPQNPPSRQISSETRPERPATAVRPLNKPRAGNYNQGLPTTFPVQAIRDACPVCGVGEFPRHGLPPTHEGVCRDVSKDERVDPFSRHPIPRAEQDGDDPVELAA